MRVIFSLGLFLICQVFSVRAYAAIAQAEFTYGVIVSYSNSAHNGDSIETYSDLNISKITLSAATDDGTFGGTQGNDYDVVVTITYNNSTTEVINSAINWRETSGSTTRGIGIIPDTGQGWDGKSFLLRLSTSSITYDSPRDAKGNAANPDEAFAVLNQQAQNEGTAGGVSYTISGTITRGASNNGVSGATIRLYAIADTTFSNVLQTQNSDNNGDYSFNNIADGDYIVEFFSTTGNKFKAKSANGRSGQLSNANNKSVNIVSSISVNGSDLSNVDAILIDPAGIVYDESTRSPMAGAVVKFYYDDNGTQTLVPNTWLDQVAGGINTQTTASDGLYSFVLNGNAETATYSLTVTPPSGYSFPSTNIPPNSSLYTPSLGGGIETIQDQSTAPTTSQDSTYYLNFDFEIGTTLSTTSNGVINNHIPLDVIVSNVNDAPVATGQSVTTTEETAKAITLAGTDTDNDTLTYSVGQPTNGTLSGTAPSLTYTPNDDYVGSDSFTFTVNDGTVDSATATVSITVTNVNDAPVAKSLSIITDELTDKSFELQGRDEDGDTLTYIIVQLPENGSLTGENQFWTYLPIDGFSGQDVITYKVNDGQEDSEVAQVIITVNDTIEDNLAPIARNDEFLLMDTQLVSFDVLTNDEDPEGEALTILSATPSFGTVAIEDNQIQYLPPNGFKGAVKIAYTISDPEDQTASATVTVAINVDLNGELPIISVPQDLCGSLSVNANALYTRVDYGEASAVDMFGNPVPVSVIGNVALFPPGTNIVYWQATDSQGNTSIAAQKVCVNPLISLSKDQTVTEGDEVSVGVYLNGESPVYPIVVPFNVAGNATLSDHDLVDGTVTITSGTSADITFNINADSAVEQDEELNIQLSDTVNIGAKSIQTTTITENNIAPELNITVKQNGQKQLTVAKDDGLVEITASVFDPNVSDNFSFTWSSEVQIENQAQQLNQFVFDPALLITGLYKFELLVEDDGFPMGDDREIVYIKVIDSLPLLTDIDSDGDSIPDNLEGFADSDGDGIPDYLDRVNECNVLLEEQSVQNGYLVEGDPGVCLRRGQFAFDASTGGAHITDDDIAKNLNNIQADTLATNVGGIFDFISYGLPDEAQSVAITFPQRNPIPANAVYRKYSQASGWYTFVENARNTLHSTKGEPGYCPPPRSDLWTPGLNEGDWCVQVEIEDGGPNDDDGLINGTIVDPGFVGVVNPTNTSPVAADINSEIDYNDNLVIDLNDFVSDEDGDELDITSVTPQVGTAQLLESNMTYTPPANYAGVVEIVYGVADGQGGTTQAVIYVTIAPPNLAPVAGMIAAGTIEQCNESSPIDVLTTASDPNGDQVSLVSASSPHGSVEILSNGLIVFTPDCDFYGNAIINYIIEDEFNMQTSASFNIEVKQVVEVIAVTKSTGGSLHLFGLILLSVAALFRITFQHLAKCLSVLMFTCLLAFNANANNTEEACRHNDDNECIESVWPEGLFIGGQLGRSSTDINKTQLNNAYQNLAINATSLSVKDTDQSSSVGFGYQFNQYFGIDFNYSDLGERHVQFSGNVLAEQLNEYYDAAEEVFPETANGLRINFTASLPLTERFKLFAKLGMFKWEQDYQTLDPQQQGAATRSGNSYPVTVGAAYKFSQSLLFNIGIERMTLDQQKVSNMFVGLQYFPFVKASREKAVQPIKSVSENKFITPTVVTLIDSDNDGVLDSKDLCPNTSSVYIVDKTGCTLSVTETISMRLNLLFAINSSQLTSNDKLEVMKLATFMQTYPDTSVVIEGHTDARGTDKYNQWLSQQRAAVVGKLLINQHNIAPERIETIGFGETQLLIDATTEAQHALNRRTIAEITIIKNVEKKK